MQVKLIKRFILWLGSCLALRQCYRKLALVHLKRLNQEIFSCFLQPEYSDNIYLFERRIHLQKNKCIRAIYRLHDVGIVSQLNELYANLMDMAQLRRRVKDYTLFDICRPELTD